MARTVDRDVKFIFIAGLEHSGTTLLNYLLGLHPKALGLGEVAAFFSPDHMRKYMERWKSYPDVDQCSCGAQWHSCELWGGLQNLSGLQSKESMLEKYAALVQHVREKLPDREIIIDSSKGLPTLEMLWQETQRIGVEPEDFHVILIVKDVRAFAASIERRSGGSSSMFRHLRTFNWWLAANESFLLRSRDFGNRFQWLTYEDLCSDPRGSVVRLLEGCGIPADSMQFRHELDASHIVMGNKTAMRTRQTIEYDDTWKQRALIRLAYWFHRKARRLNRSLVRNDSPLQV